jgi:hypothetical protein
MIFREIFLDIEYHYVSLILGKTQGKITLYINNNKKEVQMTAGNIEITHPQRLMIY